MKKSASVALIIISVIGIFSQETVSPSDCKKHLGKFCYEYYTNGAFTNVDADAKCRQLGGELAVIADATVADYQYNSISTSTNYWIASARRTDQGFVFPDGTFVNDTIMEDRTYLQDSEKQHICFVLYNWKLRVRSCDERRYFICQFQGRNCYLNDKMFLPFHYDRACMGMFAANQSLKPMEEIPIICKKGFVIEKQSAVTCLANGTVDLKKCTPGCYPPKISSDVTIINLENKYNISDKLFVICENGFFGMGENAKTHIITTCLPGGEWSVTDFTCTNIRALRPVHNTMEEEPVMADEGREVLLSCPKEGSLKAWIKDQKLISDNDSKYKIEADGKLFIKDFSSNDTGLYTCFTTDNKYSIHNLQLSKACENYNNNYFKTETLENSTLFLECNGTRYSYNIKWFKNNERFWGNEKTKILRDGMMIFENIRLSDSAVYLCMVYDIVDKCHLNTTIEVQVKPKNKCGVIAGDFSLENIESMPWLAVLWWPTDFMPFCYGTLISDRWVVTTASCIFGSHRRKKPGFIVKLGKDAEDWEDTKNASATSIIIPAGAVVIHPNFSRRLNQNDIGLVRLENPITLTDALYPICLPLEPPLSDQNSCEHRSVRTGYVTGYGPLDSRWEYDAVMENLEIAPQYNCQVASLPSSLFCANSSLLPEGHIFAGDSGTPFQIKWNDRWYLWGIFSVGDRATNTGKYDYFSKITYFLSWVRSITNHP